MGTGSGKEQPGVTSRYLESKTAEGEAPKPANPPAELARKVLMKA
jgi:hypothetical protein